LKNKVGRANCAHGVDASVLKFSKVGTGSAKVELFGCMVHIVCGC